MTPRPIDRLVSRPHALLRLAALTVLIISVSGCGLAKRAAASFVYDRADLPAANAVPDLPYLADGDPKHRFNLFLPLADSVRTRPWPTVIFVHGGGWTEGDRDFTFGGADIYNNIGRLFAAHGIGAATVSYRLQPGVTWQQQVADVAAAVAAIRDTVRARGGDADGLVLAGHSAGSHLAARVALDPDAQRAAGFPGDAVCGVLPVSGAALDLRDRESFLIGDNYDYYVRRFAPPGTPVTNVPPAEPAPWQAEASIVPLVRPGSPPFHVIWAEGDYKALVRQNELFVSALRAAGVPVSTTLVPGSSHFRIVPTLSRTDRVAGQAMIDFVRGLDC